MAEDKTIEMTASNQSTPHSVLSICFKFELNTSSDFDKVVIDESEIESIFNKKENRLNSQNNNIKNEIVSSRTELQKKILWSDLTEGDLFILLKHKRPFKYMDLHHFKKFHLILHKNDSNILEYYLSSPKLKYKLKNNVDFKTFMNEMLVEGGVIVKIESLVKSNEITEDELENEVNVSEFEDLNGQQLLKYNEAEYVNSLQSGTDNIKRLLDCDTVTLFIKQFKNSSIKITVNKNNVYKIKKSEFNEMILFLIKNNKPISIHTTLEKVGPFNDTKYLHCGRYKIIRLFKKNGEESYKIDIKNTDPVYLAIDYKLKKNVVIKRIDSQFSSEFEYLQNINNEYVLRVLDSFNYKYYTYFVTPYYEFKDLNYCLQSNFIDNEYFSDEVIIEIIYQIAEGLSYLHDANNNTNRIVHRDLKPENIYVERFYIKENPPDIKLSIGDFGHSEIFENSVDKFNSFTGTPLYQAPEFHNNNKIEYTFNVDLWCLGFILYILLSLDYKGEYFNGNLVANDKITIENLIETKLSNTKSIFKEILINTLQKDPNKRTLKAMDMVNKLHEHRQQNIKENEVIEFESFLNSNDYDDDNEELTLENCNEELLNDEKFVKSILTLNGLELQFVNDEMKNNRNVVLIAVKENGNALKFASLDLCNDKEIVLEAIKKNSYSFKYASVDLKKDKEFLLKVLTINGLLLEYVDESLLKDRDITLTAIKQNGLALEYVDNSLMNDKEILLNSVLQIASALQFISTDIYCYNEIIFNAALQNLECLKFSNEQFNNDLFKKLILEYSKNPVQDRDCFFIQQVEKDVNYLQFVFSNEKCIEAKKNSTILNYISFENQIKYLNHLIINGSLTEEIKNFFKNLQVHQSTSLLPVNTTLNTFLEYTQDELKELQLIISDPLKYQYASDKMKNDPLLVITLAMNGNLNILKIIQFIPNDFQFNFKLIYYYFGCDRIRDEQFIGELLFLISNLEHCKKTITFYTFKNNHILLDGNDLLINLDLLDKVKIYNHYLFEEVISGISEEGIMILLDNNMRMVKYVSKKLQVEFINDSIWRGRLNKLCRKIDCEDFNTFLEYTEQDLEH